MRLIPYKVEAKDIDGDTLPWGISMVEAPEIWKKGEKGEGVVIAILDTGIDMTHPDLKDRIIGGRNFTTESDRNDITDRNGHGTHVAGTIGASEDGSGVIGIAPKCKLLILKVLDASGSGSYDGIIEAIKYATDWKGENGERVRVISMSLGGPEDNPRMHKMIKRAIDRNILVVCAAGNEGDGDEKSMEYGFPGRYNEVIQVAASDENNKLAYFSNNNKEIDVIAPGVQVLSTFPKSTYAKLSGTSMATPHISGILALLINMGERKFQRTLTEGEIYALLVQSCIPLGFEATSEGHGIPKLAITNQTHKFLKFLSSLKW
jgi:major intracellular serine protease